MVAYLGVRFSVGIATGLPGFDSLFGYGIYLSLKTYQRVYGAHPGIPG
jgi:hypothetical protein